MSMDAINLIQQLNEAIAEVKSMMPLGDEQTTKVEYTPGGAVITAIPSASPESEGGDTYFGQFKVTAAENPSEGENVEEVDISAGYVINGTTVTSVAKKTNLSVKDKTHVSLEIWYTGSTWSTDYLAEASYPTQDKKTPGDYWTLRVLIASREGVDGTWIQQHFGEMHNTRVTK